jgi:NADPH:quinone reductase-like Zn-dependent oxidoreductase
VPIARGDAESASASHRISKQARRHGVNYSLLFVRASGDQLREISSLVDSGAIRPVVDKIFPFASTNEAMAYVDKGRSKGKAVVSMR